jgi:3-deoxy-D-manno-octulosonic-acid transferase
MLLYRILSILFLPLIELYLLLRVLKKKEDKLRLRERLGYATQKRPEGDLIWLHAVSVGEANSALIMVEEMLKFFPRLTILFTSTTISSASIIASKIPVFEGRVIHQFLPVDSYFCVKNFLNFWQPKAAIFIESEIWPNLIFESNYLGISTFLVNARMSEKSFKKWNIAKNFGFRIFDYFTAIFAQTNDDEKRLACLTQQQILSYGNLKLQAQNLNFDAKELEKLKSQIGSRKFWLAASTHKGEEEIIFQVHHKLKQDFPDLLTIIVPRHPARADEIKILFENNLIAAPKSEATAFVQRSKNQIITNDTEIYLADTLGELGIFYRLASFAFIGGSLMEIGGHNPFEAIKLGCVVISGRKVFNFKEIYEKLEVQNSCVMADSQKELFEKVTELFKDENSVKVISHKALQSIESSDDTCKKIITKIDQILKSTQI